VRTCRVAEVCLTNRTTELVTYGSVGGTARKGRFYPETMTFAGPQATAKSLKGDVCGIYYLVMARQRQVNATLCAEEQAAKAMAQDDPLLTIGVFTEILDS